MACIDTFANRLKVKSGVIHLGGFKGLNLFYAENGGIGQPKDLCERRVLGNNLEGCLKDGGIQINPLRGRNPDLVDAGVRISLKAGFGNLGRGSPKNFTDSLAARV